MVVQRRCRVFRREQTQDRMCSQALARRRKAVSCFSFLVKVMQPRSNDFIFKQKVHPMRKKKKKKKKNLLVPVEVGFQKSSGSMAPKYANGRSEGSSRCYVGEVWNIP